MSSSEGRMSLREKAVAGIDSAYPHETRDQWKSRIFNHILAATAEWLEGMPRITDSEITTPILKEYPGTDQEIDIDYELAYIVAQTQLTKIVTELRKEG